MLDEQEMVQMVEAGDAGQTYGFKACLQRRPSVVGRGQVSLHARRLALGKRGRVSLDEAEAFVVDEAIERLPPFANALPRQEPTGTVVVDRDRLLRALRGQEQKVRLSIYPVNLGIVELSSEGAYALVLATSKVEEGDFWRPEEEAALPLPER